MTEHTLMYHFYATKRLSEANVKKVAALCLDSEESKVQLLQYNAISDELEVASFSTQQPAKCLSLRLYPKELLYTIDVFIMEPATEVDLSYIRQIETKASDYLKAENLFVKLHSLFVPIRRGQSLWRYFTTCDRRLYEARLDRIVEEKDTEFQNIKIYFSPLHGHVLYLDDEVMFSEADQEAYTRVLLGLETGKPKRNDFAGKEILILGGGDGGVVNELLKQKPKMVTMCDIDVEVLKLCRKYMRSACADALDEFEGPNKRIIIGDCLQHLHECIQSGKRYDFIVNDLTELPVNKEERGWMYDLATDNSQTMELALKALKSDGSYLTRGGSVGGDYFWKVFEEDCAKLGCDFKVYDSQVPSFYEEYRLYQVFFKSQ